MNLAPLASKTELRAAAVARRQALDPATRAAAAEAAADIAAGLVPDGAVVSLYSPVRGEIDPAPLARRLAALGHRLALPAVGDRSAVLTFRAWQPGEALLPGFAKIPQPTADATLVDPDLLFVPLAAFDRRAHRLGYGAGLYDRTLAALRARRPVTAYGFAFAIQEVPLLPDEPHDIALDGVVTERALVRPQAER